MCLSADNVASAQPTVAVGLDPGGTGAFGWAIVYKAGDQFTLEAAGCATGADAAIAAARKFLKSAPNAVGIDSPQYWVTHGDRRADQIVRSMVSAAGGRSSGVLHVNSLMGACLIQGALAAHLASQVWPNAALTETHPKALLRVSAAAADFVALLGDRFGSDHERDAALAAFAALAAVRRDPAWRDLRELEQYVWYPAEKVVSFWFPRTVTRLPEEAASPEVKQLAERVLTLLREGTASLTLPQEYEYASITLAIIDAIFSIGVKYGGVQAVVRRYCDAHGLARFRPSRDHLPDPSDQEPVSRLCARFQALGSERMATEVFHSRQRTSATNGILKAEAVWQFAQALREENIEYLQDVPPVPSDVLDDLVRAIPGQSSGISLRYFRMLVGAEEYIKPDRMILRFIEETTGRSTSPTRAQRLLLHVASGLKGELPEISARALDHAIWQYQRGQESARLVDTSRED